MDNDTIGTIGFQIAVMIMSLLVYFRMGDILKSVNDIKSSIELITNQIVDEGE